MKIIEILVLCIVISTSSGVRMEQNAENNAPISENRRRLPIFPKNNMRFTVNPVTRENNAQTAVTEEIATRKPVMAKLIPKSKIHSNTKYTEATRRPLMKIRTYTVTMKSRGIGSINEDRSHNKRSFIKDKEESSEETFETKSTALKPEYIEFRHKSVEDEDQTEFIFLVNNKEKVVSDLIHDSEEDIETTTGLLRRKTRRKRSSNIIEEENMGTTISGLKYTGQDARLTNNLYFNNINS